MLDRHPERECSRWNRPQHSRRVAMSCGWSVDLLPILQKTKVNMLRSSQHLSGGIWGVWESHNHPRSQLKAYPIARGVSTKLSDAPAPAAAIRLLIRNNPPAPGRLFVGGACARRWGGGTPAFCFCHLLEWSLKMTGKGKSVCVSYASPTPPQTTTYNQQSEVEGNTTIS